MNKSTVIRTGVAGAVAAAGLVAGGTVMANADDSASSSTSTQTEGRDGGRGEGGRGGAKDGVGVRDTAAFATALGVSEDDLTAALASIRADLKAARADTDEDAEGERPDRSVRQAALASALADELDISEDKVTSALDGLRDDATSDRRSKLTERLDTAVDDADLTEADKAAVLKAFDAGVLGGGPR